MVVRTDLFEGGADGRPTGGPVASAPEVRTRVRAGSRQAAYAQAKVDHPKRWDLSRPNLYVAITTVEQDHRPLDRCETPFGIRTIQFTPDQGFLLNGQRVQIQGVCDHHDLGALGAALNDRALQRQLEILKGMGCNAIRTSHNPPAPELLTLCDRPGSAGDGRGVRLLANRKSPTATTSSSTTGTSATCARWCAATATTRA